MYNYEKLIKNLRTTESPEEKSYSNIRPRTRNPSIKTLKTKMTEYKNPQKSNIINIYPKNISNISFDYSNNNEYNLLNYGNRNINNLIKEKNSLIKNLQNQINNYIVKSKEINKKLNIQEQIITTLKNQIQQLNNDIIRKKNIIEQNEDIDYKILKLKKDVEKSRDKKLNDDYNESKRHNFILNNKINNFKQEIKEKNEIIQKLQIKNNNFIKKLKENEIQLKNQISEINRLNEENNMIKNRFEELEKSFDKLSHQLNIVNFPKNENNINNNNIFNNNYNNNNDKMVKNNINDKTKINMEEIKIMEMKKKDI